MHWYTERFGTAFAHCPVRLCVPYSVGKEWALSSAFYFPYSVFFTLPHLPGALMLIIVGFFPFGAYAYASDLFNFNTSAILIALGFVHPFYTGNIFCEETYDGC
jgi:hypothetical protein